MTNTGKAMTNSELRKFGLLTAGMLVLFFDILIPWIWNFSPPLWPLIAAGVLSLMALALPATLAPVYKAWMAFAEVLGWINTRIILGLMFFVIFVPFGLIMRLFTDPLNRKLDDSAASYRVESTPPKNQQMERPF